MDEINEIWTEKYRPRNISEIVGQEHIKPKLAAFLRTKSLPHCLFAGSHGVGKTTAAIAIARELYGNQWHGNFLELNASDERGIDVIRIKVKDFARTVPFGVPFKIIYLDEADALTTDAQHALRRTMEKYSSTVRFIFSCNYSSKIIPPIQSRTAVFRFSGLKNEEILQSLKHICSCENIKVDDEAYDSIIYASEGDMRKAVNILQTCAVSEKEITKKSVFSATNMADPESVKKLLELSLAGNFLAAKTQLEDLLFMNGLSGEDIMKELHSQLFRLDIPDRKKITIVERMGEYEFRMTEGSNPRIQLLAFIANIALLRD